MSAYYNSASTRMRDKVLGTMALRRLLIVLFSVSLMGAAPVPTPKEQCEVMLGTVLQLAEKLLKKHGEFYPFGATMKPDGEIALTAAYDGTDDPPSAQLIELLHDGFRLGAEKGAHIATALAYDVRVVPPGTTEKTDAVSVELDHRDHYSVVVFVPYKIVNGDVEFAAAFANAGKHQVYN